jgi:hypothetical protein
MKENSMPSIDWYLKGTRLANTGEMLNAHTVLVRKPEGKITTWMT